MLAEVLLGEPADVCRVLFVADHNTAAAALEGVYATRSQIWTLVIAKAGAIPDLFTPEEARQLLRDGGMRLPWAGHDADHARIILTAIGGYQLVEALSASARLAERGVGHAVVYLLEPGRFRAPRNEREARHIGPATLRTQLYPESVRPRLFLTHTRPEPMLGALAPLSTGDRTVGLGFVNQGATLDVEGMLFVNRATWAHAVDAASRLLDVARDELLTADEQAALDHRRSPEGVLRRS